jgi:hypothetical protein
MIIYVSIPALRIDVVTTGIKCEPPMIRSILGFCLHVHVSITASHFCAYPLIHIYLPFGASLFFWRWFSGTPQIAGTPTAPVIHNGPSSVPKPLRRWVCVCLCVRGCVSCGRCELVVYLCVCVCELSGK